MIDYNEKMQKLFLDHESKCLRCGCCCGAEDGDQCANLKKGHDGLYACNVYENRFGMQKTLSGKEFMCVPIRNIIFKSWTGSWKCPYVAFNREAAYEKEWK